MFSELIFLVENEMKNETSKKKTQKTAGNFLANKKIFFHLIKMRFPFH